VSAIQLTHRYSYFAGNAGERNSMDCGSHTHNTAAKQYVMPANTETATINAIHHPRLKQSGQGSRQSLPTLPYPNCKCPVSIAQKLSQSIHVEEPAFTVLPYARECAA